MRRRERARRNRAAVLQELATSLAAAIRADWQANKARAAALRRGVKGGGSDEARLGLVTRKTRAGGTGSPCNYCGLTEGHTAQCPVVS